jgi:hypothetical protein
MGVFGAVTAIAGVLASPQIAAADPTCGVSNSHTVCVTPPSSTLTGPQFIQVTSSPNSGTMLYTWVPSGKANVLLMTQFSPSPQRKPNDYSFTWPTQKYLDGTGVLRLQVGSTAASPVDVPVTLSNGNTTDFRHSPNDWSNYLPGPWTGNSDPVVAAVGDGASDEKTPNAVAASIAANHPALALYLGDIYENGTFTEDLNHYGVSSMDAPGSGSLWGAFANVTQPTFGNHEGKHLVDWTDYWHGRPTFTSFTFGGVLFFDLYSGASRFQPGSQQYTFVQQRLASAPPCVVAFWHHPALNGSTVNTTITPMWQLLADNGGDLTLHGHAHYMAQYEPLDDQLQPGPSAHMVEIISGAGGHKLTPTKVDARTAWPTTALKTAGAVYITLVGAANGGTARSLSWQFMDSSGAVLHTGSTTC